MSYIYGSFDGPLYIIPAKTLYNPDLIDVPGKGLIISLPLSAGYFAAHLPGFPLLIRLFASVVKYPTAMLFATLTGSCAAAIAMYEFLVRLKLTKHPLIVTAIFLMLPRFLVVRSVGSPEPMFIALTLISILCFEKKQYLWAGIAGGIAAATKTPGILLFAAYGAVFAEQYVKSYTHKQKLPQFDIRMLWLGLIPLGLLGVFVFYANVYHDFFAYFHTNGVVPMPYPFAAFNGGSRWVEGGWLEDIFFYFFMYTIAAFYLWKSKYRSLAYYSIIFLGASVFIQHRDIARYTIPLWPLAVVAFEPFFTSRAFRIAALILLPAIYFYAWNFLLYNKMPIGDWSPYL